MAAPREKQRTEQHDDDPSHSVSKLRLRAEARQRRLLLSSASRRLQVLGGCPPEDEGISAARGVQNCAANYEGQELRCASPVHYFPTANEDGSASGNEEVRRGLHREVITTPRSQHAQGAPPVAFGGSRCGAQHPSSTSAEVLPECAAGSRLNVNPTLGLERRTCLRREADGSISYSNGNYRGKTTCPAPRGTRVSFAESTKQTHALCKYLAPFLLGYISRRLGILLTAALTALHANLVLLRRIHVFGFVALAVMSALLPCAVLPEDLTSTAVPTPESAALPAITSGRLRGFLRHVFLCFASQPLVCVLCATCGLILVEHAPAVVKQVPTVVKQALSAGEDHKVPKLHDSPTSPRQQTRQSACELLQHQERPEDPAAPASHPGVCCNGSRENNDAAGTQRSAIRSRVNLLHALLSYVFFVLQCYASLLRVLQQLAVFIVLHCITRTVLVQLVLLAGCIEQQLRPLEGPLSTG